MLRGFVCFCFGSVLSLQAGLIKGVVLEHASGRPLARTLVRLEPIPSGKGTGQPIAIRAGAAGEFSFGSVPEGLYRIVTQRTGYFPAAYGQRRPTGHGTPVQVTSDSDLFSELRMRRIGAITGSVLDENGIGIPGMPVVAYRARLPLRVAGRAVSDDRGVYRIGGLSLGKHWVRTGSHTLEDGTGLLPTFGPQSREIREARIYDVVLDVETPDAHIRPEAGSLHRLSGPVLCDNQRAGRVNLTLSSETGRQSMEAFCDGQYAFENLAPAAYEISAVYGDGSGSGFIELQLRRDSVVPVQVTTTLQTEFEVRDAANGGVSRTPVAVGGGRTDLSGAGELREIKMPRAPLIAGHWEFRAITGPGEYVEFIASLNREIRRPWRQERPAEAHEVFIETRFPSKVRISVSDRAAHIAGSVINDRKPVAGAPVFLWPVAESARRILGGPRQVLSDIEGKFQFDGLPPGEYRVLSTFDYIEVSPEILEEARATTMRLEPAQTATIELPLWLAP